MRQILIDVRDVAAETLQRFINIAVPVLFACAILGEYLKR